MDTILLLKGLLLGIVEGLTEFLPVSSTGHLIVAGGLLGFHDDKAKVFEIVVQAGAILAVCWEYRQRLLTTFAGITHDRVAQRFTRNLLIAFLPLAVLGLLLHKPLEAALFKPLPVALAFVVGGVIILFAERWVDRRQAAGIVQRIDSVDALTWQDALKLGLAQCAALIPGASRSGATIIGGLFFGLSRRCSAEFSFYLAIPTILAATFYKLWSSRALLSLADLPLFGVGLLAAFVSALVVVRWLIRFVSNHDFRAFGWYRIAFGAVILATAWTGLVDWTPQH